MSNPTFQGLREQKEFGTPCTPLGAFQRFTRRAHPARVRGGSRHSPSRAQSPEAKNKGHSPAFAAGGCPRALASPAPPPHPCGCAKWRPHHKMAPRAGPGEEMKGAADPSPTAQQCQAELSPDGTQGPRRASLAARRHHGLPAAPRRAAPSATPPRVQTTQRLYAWTASALPNGPLLRSLLLKGVQTGKN